MAFYKHINPFSKINNDTGFGNNASSYGGRFVNRDGSFNMKKEGIDFWNRFSIFHSMLNLKTWKFIAVIILFYFFINLLFAILFFLAGSSQMDGILGKTPWAIFKELYFFSTQTFTTVGYGRINPVGNVANVIASIEALCGFLSFAIVTGLLYGRFSKPKAYLIFSENAVIAPYKDISGLMFRFASYKDNHTLTNVEIKVSLGLILNENGADSFKFYDLELERSRVDSLPMNWTVVHPIDEHSPLSSLNADDIKALDVEVYVLVRGFDDVYSNIVLQRTSYTYEEIRFNRKFVPMYRESPDGKTTILELQKINQFVEVVGLKESVT